MMIGGYTPISTAVINHQFAANEGNGSAPADCGARPQNGRPAKISYEPSAGLLMFPIIGARPSACPHVQGKFGRPRTQTATLGQHRGNVPIAAVDEWIVIASNCCSYTYSCTNGPRHRIRASTGERQQRHHPLNNPNSFWIRQRRGPGSNTTSATCGQVVFMPAHHRQCAAHARSRAPHAKRPLSHMIDSHNCMCNFHHQRHVAFEARFAVSPTCSDPCPLFRSRSGPGLPWQPQVIRAWADLPCSA